MLTETEEIMGVRINYDPYVKRNMEEYRLWMPFTYELARNVFQFINDNFWFETIKPEITIWLHYDYASHGRTIEFHVRLKEAGYGEAELFTMDVFSGSYVGVDAMTGFTKNFMKRFQQNIIRSAVMEKIELYRNPPKPLINWRITDLTGLALARTAIGLSSVFVVMTVVYIVCLYIRFA